MGNKEQSKPYFSTVQSTITYFKSKGATQGKKTGSFLMPLSKAMREAMQKDNNDRKDNRQ